MRIEYIWFYFSLFAWEPYIYMYIKVETTEWTKTTLGVKLSYDFSIIANISKNNNNYMNLRYWRITKEDFPLCGGE